jgi:hypothetical protein
MADANDKSGGGAGKAGSGLNQDGGCAVDWSWLAGERIASVTNGLDTVTITFESGLVFTTRALLWQGKPFLSFDPHAPPRV